MKRLHSILIAVAIVGCAAPAFAQRRGDDIARVGGTYAGTFEVVANNCDNEGMKLGAETITVRQDDRAVTIAIRGVPDMKGQLGRRGKLRAEAPKTRSRAGSFGISGRIDSGKLHMVFIAEYYRGGKPLCTQSWSVTGRRK